MVKGGKGGLICGRNATGLTIKIMAAWGGSLSKYLLKGTYYARLG